MSDNSTVAALLVELWTKIFRATKDAEEGSLLVGNARDTPYVISQVCADWRDIILEACPDVWADMKVVMGRGDGGLGLKAWDALVLAAMERSGSHLLDIEFYGIEQDPSDYDSVHCFQYLLGEDIVAFSAAGSLGRLAFTGLGTNANLKFPARNITHFLDIRLHVRSDIHDDVVWLLASASSLKSLELLYSDIFIHSNQIPHPTMFSSVSYFRTTNLRTLNAVSMPNLETLAVEPARVGSSNIHETELHINTLSAVCDMVRHSGCYVSLCTIKMYNVPLYSISNLVRLVPWIKVMCFGFTRWSGEYNGAWDSLLANLTASTVDIRGIRRLRWMQDLSSLSLTIETHAPHRSMEARVPANLGSPFEFLIEFKYGAERMPEMSKEFQDRLDFCQQLDSSYKNRRGQAEASFIWAECDTKQKHVGPPLTGRGGCGARTIARTPPAISRLPVELWTNIFLCTKEGPDRSFQIGNIAETGYHIAAVCREWREIIVAGCPALWANLTVDFEHSSHNTGHRLLSPLSLVLKRSATHPLDVLFKSSGREEYSEVSVVVLASLIGHSSRWRSADLQLNPSQMPWLERVRNECPRLLSCWVALLEPDLFFADGIQVFEYAPSLKTLAIYGLQPITALFLDVAGLTSFADTRDSIADFVLNEILGRVSLAASLTKLELHYFMVVGDFDSTKTHAISPTVCEFGTCSKLLMDAFTLPALETLRVEPPSLPWPRPFALHMDREALVGIRDLLTRSRCQNTLRHILIQSVHLMDDILSILGLSPALDSLRVVSNDWHSETDLVFQHLLLELRWVDSDGSLSCMPSLSLLAVTVESDDALHPITLTFLNDDFAYTLRARIPILPSHHFSLSIKVNGPHVAMPPLSNQA
ncbi:hypothetical protein ARMSODRAFT_982904 [Armillaria solidipes]|uniref:F-box domain-containing protein n=1 Tax=Armillaria solidipes TaxID=1076256 RepID=A0A2H3B9A6_9AGAR|nr:hypothetical protein ARMSODRAFT_982904 [Armillaria solidipes]